MRSSIRLLSVLGVLLFALVWAAGCGERRAEAPGPGEEVSGKPFVIGAMFAVTGDASSLGIPEKKTAEMLEKMINADGGINGRPLEIVIEDTKGEEAEALKAARRLVEANEVLAIVGPSRTGTTLAVMDYMESAEVPLISCAAGVDIVEPVRKWVFKTPQTDRMAIEKIIEHLRGEKISRIAFLADNTELGKRGTREAEKLMPAAGIKVVAREEYAPRDTSMEQQLAKIAKTKAQAVVCWGTPPGPAIVARNMRQLGMEMPLICSHGVANETFLKVAGEAANGVVLPAGRLVVLDQIATEDPQRPVLEDYADKYKAEAGSPADSFGGYAWDGIQLVVSAIGQAGEDRAGIRDAIEGTTDFLGASGVFNFSAEDHNGLTKDAFVMVKVVEGKWRLAY
ncbi:MAG: ABC transporter substrate-binding protein [Armatimonadota bacterium]|nr:MAG: ABC transporter substrate-binding protein [Armatimonadota bacterium]